MDASRREPELEALLRESAWVRRLARGLVGEGAAADDLAQDVLVAALDRRPGLEGSRLRGWLHTVARRLALRTRERRWMREHVERATAPRDDADRAADLAADRDAERRVELLRELSAALGELEAADRTALMLRYFDGLSSAELARQLGLAEPAGRKRVSRALERLRARLDARSGGDRRVWSVAFVAALTPRSSDPLLPTLPTATLLAGLMTKTTWTVAALGVVCIWLAASRPWIARPSESTEAIVAVGPELAELRPTSDDSRQDVAILAQNERLPLDVAAATEAPPAAHVRVVDADGAAVAGARAAWIDAAGAVSALELGPDGSAQRPGASPGTRFFALAEGHGCGFARAGSQEADVVITLPRMRTLMGRVVEDGEAPREPLRLRHQAQTTLPGVASSEFGVEEVLRALDVPSAGRVVLTEVDGFFSLPGLTVGVDADLRLPATHRLLAVDGRPQDGSSVIVRIPADATAVVLETARLPRIVGRMVWEDTGEPLCGTLMVMFRDRRVVSDMATAAWLDDQGHFSLGVPIEPRALLEPFETRGAAVTERSVRIMLDGVDSTALAFEHTIDLTDVSFPHDVGILRVPRAPVLHVRLVRPDGTPIRGAAIASDLERATSDVDGRVSLAADQGPLRVLALDCALGEFAVPEAPTFPEAPLELLLAAGATFELVAHHGDTANPWAGRSVRFSWSESPFEGARFIEPGRAEPMPAGLYRQHFGWAYKDLGWSNTRSMPGQVSFVLPVRGPLLVPGWRLGATARLELLDAVDEPLAEVEVRVPNVPGRFTVDLTGLAPDTGRLRLRVVDTEGRSFPRASFHVRAQGGTHTEYVNVDGSSLDLGPLALGLYDVSVSVTGFIGQRIEGLEASPDAPERELTLLAARTLNVMLVDEAGQSLRASALEVHGEGRRWRPSTNRDELVGTANIGGLPLTPLELTVVIGTRTWTRVVDAEQTALSLDLPVHGRLVSSLRAREFLTGDDGRLVVKLRELDGEGSLAEEVSVDRGGVGPTAATFDLLPGRYELSVDLVEYAEGSLETDEPSRRALLRREVEVRARERTVIEAGQ
jgi:RNA polymerase sigma factor (sigma-70 family)